MQNNDTDKDSQAPPVHPLGYVLPNTPSPISLYHHPVAGYHYPIAPVYYYPLIPIQAPMNKLTRDPDTEPIGLDDEWRQCPDIKLKFDTKRRNIIRNLKKELETATEDRRKKEIESQLQRMKDAKYDYYELITKDRTPTSRLVRFNKPLSNERARQEGIYYAPRSTRGLAGNTDEQDVFEHTHCQLQRFQFPSPSKVEFQSIGKVSGFKILPFSRFSTSGIPIRGINILEAAEKDPESINNANCPWIDRFPGTIDILIDLPGIGLVEQIDITIKSTGRGRITPENLLQKLCKIISDHLNNFRNAHELAKLGSMSERLPSYVAGSEPERILASLNQLYLFSVVRVDAKSNNGVFYLDIGLRDPQESTNRLS